MVRLGITVGDPAGIGPEVTLKALANQASKRTSRHDDIVLYAQPDVIQAASRQCGILLTNLAGAFRSFVLKPVAMPKGMMISSADPDALSHTSLKGKWKGLDLLPPQPSAVGGQVALTQLEMAIEDAKNGQIQALVTAPICKESLAMAKSSHTGHTTILNDAYPNHTASMCFYTRELRVVLATVHKPLSRVPALLTPELLKETFQNAVRFMVLQGKKSPKIAVAGLNPHASENGLFGTEEAEIIQPAMNAFKSECQGSFSLMGPYSPDTVFYRAIRKEFDCVVALYHDQGLIPIKLIGFDRAVNTTVGLPLLRTSPDHGTAFDIAGQNKANPNSMIAAIRCARKWIRK